MIAALLALALAADLQEVHQLEWDRAPTTELAAFASDEDPVIRAATARALGRLHREDAVPALDSMRGDADHDVRIAVADALGGTPGAAETLRAWIAELPAPKRLSERAAADPSARTRAIEALGRQGDASDIPLLSELLDEPWPTSVAAAEALGRLGRRKVEGAQAGLGPLADALRRPDPRTVTAAAYGIGRIGLSEADPEVLTRVATAHPSEPVARAWLSKAVLAKLDGAPRSDRIIGGLTDPSPYVQVAVLDAIQADTVPADVIAPWLTSKDAWVRQATIAALGRLGDIETLTRVAVDSDDPWEVAWVIQSAEDPLGRDWSDTELPDVVRAAALSTAGLEPDALIAIAKDGQHPKALHTAAAGTLLSAEEPDPAWADPLLGSPDVVVREAALELAKELPPEELIALLEPWLRVEPDPVLRETGRKLLAEASEEDAPAVKEPDERVRELVLPDGSVVEVEAGSPVVSEVHRIRGARVSTSAGEFVISLDPMVAPLAVANFAKLAEKDFFDGVVFHRVVPGFVIQTGCPRGDGWGGPGWSLPDELTLDPYTHGSVGMARGSEWDTGGSQWFVTTGPTPHLEGDYTRFGEVVQGMDVVRRIRRGDTVLDVKIERIDPR